jgi:hypothetical protein
VHDLTIFGQTDWTLAASGPPQAEHLKPFMNRVEQSGDDF